MAQSKLHACAKLVIGLAAMAAAQSVMAEVKMPSVFGSHMVLQQDKPITVWGWAAPGEAVKVDVAGQEQSTKANDAGEWRVSLPALKAGGPFVMNVTGTNALKFEDILVGEVWVCSGQSNMEMGIGAAGNGQQEIAQANHPNIRLFMIPKVIGETPQSDVSATWVVCSPDTVNKGGWGGFSAAGYYFGRELNQQLSVPVGLIQSAWGGTRIEPWTPPVGFAQIPTLKGIEEQIQLADPRSPQHKQKVEEFLSQTLQWVDQARSAAKAEKAVPAMPTLSQSLVFKKDPQTPTGLYNAMINPIVPFAIRGAIWYQGESNCGEGALYTKKMQALVGGWRQIWNEGEFPFYFTQIASYNYGDQAPTVLPEFWEAQINAMQIPNTGMASTMDIGDYKDIHPKNKQEVGRRLALWALAKTYGKNVEYCGPIYKAMSVEGNKVRVTFDHLGGGLASRDGKPLNWFEMIDAETGGFVPADAAIEGDAVVLSAKDVQHPAAIRFAWNKAAEPNLSSKAGLPALPFRAGDVPKRDALTMIPGTKDYQLLYDIDLAKLGPTPTYDVDNHAKVTGKVDRVAYFLELQQGSGDVQYAYVAMDAFTTDLAKLGIPTYASGAKFQQNATNMDVYSNVPGVANGVGIKGGNIEFWPNNYSQGNGAKVPNASDTAFDFGDLIGDPADGYGSMQIHNHGARQTILALNHWKEGGRADLGIGNQPGNNPDWTFAANANSYQSKRLRVFVHVK